MFERDVAWLAGILEGEGTFFMRSRNRKGKSFYLYPVVSVEMCDEDVLQSIREVVGSGTVYASATNSLRKTGWKVTYKLTWEGGKAIELMTLVLPYMHSRRAAKIREILSTNEVERQRAKDNFISTRPTAFPRRMA